MIPVDGMLDDLRTALEAFQDTPTEEMLDRIFKETLRIDLTCEDEYWGNEG